jgi:hypothetical protein
MGACCETAERKQNLILQNPYSQYNLDAILDGDLTSLDDDWNKIVRFD